MTNENDWVFDPFAGVGSTLLAAIRIKRKAIGAEKEHEYVKITEERIKQYFSGTLKVRRLGKKVYQPSGKEKITQIPFEWTQNKGNNP